MKTLKSMLILGLAVLVGSQARAGLNVPYTNDVATLHLWHFDDATNQLAGNFLSVTDAISTASGGITMTNYGLGTNSSGAASGTPPFTNIMLMPNTAAFGTLKGCLMLTNGWSSTPLKVDAYCGNTNNVSGYPTNTVSGYYADTTPFRNPTS